MNVMLIDDDQDCRDCLSSALRLNGFSVDCFETPQQALQAYDPDSIDVVITDYHLPGMKGTDVIAEIHQKRTDAPVIIITGDPKLKIDELASRAGAFAFYRKPLTVKELIAKIKTIGTV
jgi:DNA-binding NtrC family response regulator